MNHRLELCAVRVTVRDGNASRTILDIPELCLPASSLVGVRGASGAGKTTLLRLLSGLRLPDTGSVRWGDTELTLLTEAARDHWRGSRVGFVFQDFRLFPTLSALENVLVPATFRRCTVPAELHGRALGLLAGMGLSRSQQRAATLSRGEQQRVAVARALLFRPSLILADEPTASLDAANAKVVMDTLLDYASKEKAGLWVVSHDLAVLDRLALRLRLERGRIVHDAGNGSDEPGSHSDSRPGVSRTEAA